MGITNIINYSPDYNSKNVKPNVLSGVFSTIKEIRKNLTLYSMALPAIVLLLLFSYFPMFGLIIAFKEFKIDKGIIGSDWARPIYNNFIFLFSSDAAFKAILNTVLLNALFIISGLAFEVGLALMINEIRSYSFKKLTQSLTFIPYFISWIVVGVFSYNILNYDTGAINSFLQSVGMEKIDWFNMPEIWPIILVVVNRWKWTGYGAVVYLAALSGIDTSYYEAAEIDGATKWQQIKNISIPMIIPTIIILTLLSIGRIMNADFGMFYAIIGDNPQLYPTTDVIDTFVFRNLRVLGDVGMASATAFIQSFISCLLVICSNAFIRKYDRNSALY